jgi:DNA polymerase III delta prime subunit
MNQDLLNDADFDTKEWWIKKLNVILKDSDYIAIDNPTVKENNVVVIKKGTLLPHFVGIKPSKISGKYSLFTKQEIYEIASEQYEVPQPDKVKGKLPHFNQLEDPDFAFHLAMVLADDYGWFPSPSEYDPKITKDMWLDFFCNSSKFNDNYKHMMTSMLALGGQASCVQLEERFGNTASHYSMTAVHMAEQAHKYFDCPLFQGEVRDAKLWTLLFKGRQATSKERGTYIWKMRRPLKEALNEYVKKSDNLGKVGEKVKQPDNIYDKNLILYGPPGTGKTYSSAIYAVAICDRKSIDELTDYAAVMARFNELRDEGRIAFTTFHQSYGYEEFIEGIKPYTDEDTKSISYSVEPGVFKSFCETAKKKSIEGSPLDIPDDARVWKVTIRPNVRKDCFENDRIRINWEYDSDIAVRFVDDITKGDLIVTTDGSRTVINGIAVAVDDDAFIMTDADSDRQTRKVKWLSKNIAEEVASINAGKQLSRPTVHRVPSISIANLMELAAKKNKELSSVEIQENNKPYVFIIDEINRGNISKIFGELITLIEGTKRAGEPEAACAILPYSGETFSVPSNVYLLGTMNTADRSIALMDTALRRRFSFEELMPDADVLRKIGADKVDDLDVAAMLEKINERITFLYDREHTIGHAFFTRLKDEPTIAALSAIFKKSVLPLLQEYFYEDYQKIQLVLGDNAKTDDALKFVKDEKVNIRQIFKGNADELIDIEKRYTINDAAFGNIESYKQI